MTPREPRHPDYYVGKNWFQWAVLLVILGLLAIGLISALNDVKDEAERQMVDLTMRNMRTGMQLAMGEALMHQREVEIGTWAGANPVRWLGSSPTGYRGNCSALESQALSGGEWCFVSELSELVYQPLRVASLQADGAQHRCRDLRSRVMRAPGAVERDGFSGLGTEAASDCRWAK